jgi:acyl-CoA thioester hydrolase
MSEPPEETRQEYPHLAQIATRWMDNDTYGHVNNVVYYSYFDSLINAYLINVGGHDIARGEAIGVAVESSCRFHCELSFPEVIDACLRVAHLGNSSVRYEIGLFRQGSEKPAATGYFVHVFIDRQTRRPRPISDTVRAALERIRVPGPA